MNFMEDQLYPFVPAEISDQVQQKWILVDILLISVFTILLIIGGFGILKFFSQWSGISKTDESNNVLLSFGSLVIEIIALIIPIYALGTRYRKKSWSDFGIKSFHPDWFWGAGILGFVAIPLSGFVAIIVQLLLKQPLENPQLQFLVPSSPSIMVGFLMLLFGGILVPFAEELFFRGFLLQWFRQRWGSKLSILASALIFGIAHGDWAIGSAAFVLGIILGWSFDRSKSLWVSFIIHAINNSIKIAVLYFLLIIGFLSEYI